MSISSNPNVGGSPTSRESVDSKPRWKQLFDNATADPLQQTRDAAGKWAQIFSALVGVSTVLGFIQGHDAFSKLSFISQISFAVTFFSALLATLTAVYLAAVTSEGTPAEVAEDEAGFNRWYREAKVKAIRNLKLSRYLAIVGVLLLAISLGITLFGSGQQTTGTSILAVQRSGTVVCGNIQKDKVGNLILAREGQKPISLNNILSISIVSSCP